MTGARFKGGPSQRYPTMLVEDGATLLEAIAGCKALGEECVLWVHETDARRWDFPRLPSEGIAYHYGARIYGNHGWMIVAGEPAVHIAVVDWLGDFGGTADPDELGVQVEAWREHVGMAYLFSAADTIHKLILSFHALAPAEPEPELDGWAPTALASPGTVWESDTFTDPGVPWVRCYDRSGSYLAAWSGLRLTAGPWNAWPSGVAEKGPESSRPAGYWQVAPSMLPAVPLFNPWRRQGMHDEGEPVWLTTPLVQLAVDLLDTPLPYMRAWVTQQAGTWLTQPADRLKTAREALDLAGHQPALDALKVGYAAATAWFEYGPKPPKPLGRPYWRRAILDRYTANTWRNLAKARPAPIALTDIDCAIFPLERPDGQPAGLRLGRGLGAWKPKGPPIPIESARAAGGARQISRLADGADR